MAYSQNMIYDHPSFPKELKAKIYDYIKVNCLDEKKEGQTEEQFLYKTRKKAIGPFKKECWDLPQNVQDEIRQKLYGKFVTLFEKLNVINTKNIIAEVINPKAKKIFHLRCYPSVLSVEDKIDLAIIVVPASLVAKVMEECGQKGIRNIVIISAGFREQGKKGLELENEIAKLKGEYKFRILGPNCLGFINFFWGSVVLLIIFEIFLIEGIKPFRL